MIEDKPYYQLDSLPKKLMYNQVLVEIEVLNKERKTDAGIILASGRDDSKLQTSEVFDQIDRMGVVAMLPPRLAYNPNSASDSIYNGTMEWETEIEIEVGDKVWMRQIDANVAPRFQLGNRYFKLIKYEHLNVARRGDKVICLNGQVLLEPYYELESKIILLEKKVKKNYGIVKYLGSKNKDYKSNWVPDNPNYYRSDAKITRKHINAFSDDLDVEVGDLVIVDFPEVFLESDYINQFGDKLKIAQRRHIVATLNN